MKITLDLNSEERLLVHEALCDCMNSLDKKRTECLDHGFERQAAQYEHKSNKISELHDKITEEFPDNSNKY